MPNPFVEYISAQIAANPKLLGLDNDGAGARSRVFDNMTIDNNAIFGAAGQQFLNQAEKLYKKRVFTPPYTKENVETTHDIFMNLNNDIEKSDEWKALGGLLKSKNPSLTDDDITRLKQQFLAAYRFKVISAFNTLLQERFPNEKLNIIRTEGPFLQTLNGLIKNDREGRHLNKTEFMQVIINDRLTELRDQLRDKNNFTTFFGSKVEKVMKDLSGSVEGFKVVFDHFNKTDRSLTHSDPALVSYNEIRGFLQLIEKTSAENNEFKEFLKNDPSAFVFLTKAKQTMEKAGRKDQDAAILKFLDKSIASSEVNPKSFPDDLKKIERKTTNGDLKTQLLTTIRSLEATPSTLPLPNNVIDEIKKLKALAASENVQSGKKNESLDRISQICDTYIKINRETQPRIAPIPPPPVPTSAAAASLPPPSAAAAAAASLLPPAAPAPLLASFKQHSSESPFHTPVQAEQEKTPKKSLVLMLNEKATSIEKDHTSTQEDLAIVEMIRATAKKINEIDDDDLEEINSEIVSLKSNVNSFSSQRAGVFREDAKTDISQTSNDIEQYYSQFQAQIQKTTQRPKAN